MTIDIKELYQVDEPSELTLDELRRVVSELNRHLLEISRRLGTADQCADDDHTH